MSKTCALYHVVINTHYRKMTIPESSKKELYKYLYGILTNKGCHTLRINGIGNHVHLLFDMPPTLSLSSVMQSLKQSSSRWMLRNPLFPFFEGWGKEYFAVSVSPSVKDSIINYIRNQETHHLKIGFEEEIETFYEEIG